MAVQISGNDITVPRDGSFTRNVTIGGTLTYEDVTNIDSVGLVTARTGIEIGARPGVGASISVDGNAIFSGITTATTIKSNTGIVTTLTSTTFNVDGGDATFKGTTSGRDVIFDTSLNQIRAQDNAKLCAGSSSDLEIYHTGSASYIDNYTGALYLRNNVSSDVNGDIYIQAKSGENSVACYDDGAVELYYDNELQALTAGNGLRIKTAGDTDTELSVVGPEGRNGIINLEADDGDDNADIWGFVSGTDGKFLLRNYTSGSYENNLRATGNGAVELYHNNSIRFQTTTSGVTAGTPDTSQTAVVGAQAGFFGGAKSEYASATGLVQNEVCIVDTATSAAAGTGGALTFAGYIDTDSTTFYATIEGVKETSTTNQYGGRLKFLTRTNGVANMVQGMVIDSTGRVGLGAATDTDRTLDVVRAGTNIARFQQTTNNTGEDHTCITLRHAAATSGQNGVGMIFQNTGGSVVGKIDFGHSTTQYRTSSDYRLKENAVTISYGITRLKTLNPYRFNFKIDPSTTVDGFFAHEVTAVPEAISGTKDEVDSDNNPVYQGIDHSKLVPLLTAALQESVTEIESLKARLDAAGL